MADDLDSLVKGAPLPGTDPLAGGPSPFGGAGTGAGTGTGPIAASTSAKAGDPLSHTPSSPSMIYLNLLVLEASLRAQYLALRARRRHHTFFLILLSGWVLGFGYALFLAPREDGSGVGGSVYWVVDVTEKVCFMGGIITALLVWATGIWERGVRWPRRWFSVSNRGLRHINCKLVLLKRPWYAEALSTLGWFLTYGVFSNAGSAASYRYVEPSLLREVDRELHLSASGHPVVPVVDHRDEEKGGGRAYSRAGHEEDLAPGGDYVKLLLLAKPFSPTFRENWEIYRQEYWDRENERRALIRRRLKEQDLALRRSTGGWFWWLPGSSPATASGGGAGGAASRSREGTPDSLRGHPPHHHHPQHPRHAAVEREHRRTRSSSSRRTSMSMQSGPSSRSSTPGTLEPDDAAASAAAAASVVSRKSSTGSNTSDRRRKKSSVSGQSGTRTAAAAVGGPRRPLDRAVTPEKPSPLARESSFPPDPADERRGSRA